MIALETKFFTQHWFATEKADLRSNERKNRTDKGGEGEGEREREMADWKIKEKGSEEMRVSFVSGTTNRSKKCTRKFSGER